MSNDIEPNRLGALQAADLMRHGELSSEALVEACLARIDEREDAVRAWTHLDRDLALEQARHADREMKAGR
ncbi:MAG TPA: hypothetical protein VK973_00855, partial [Arenicellales bacterium]|nr:hypothetical protein [Arenicellales bacterium]